MAEFPLSLPLSELLIFRIIQGQKLGWCVNKELERIIAEQCLYIYLRGKAIAIGAVRSHPFTSECPLILVVISRVLAVRHNPQQRSIRGNFSEGRKVIAPGNFKFRIPYVQPTKEMIVWFTISWNTCAQSEILIIDHKAVAWHQWHLNVRWQKKFSFWQMWVREFHSSKNFNP